MKYMFLLAFVGLGVSENVKAGVFDIFKPEEPLANLQEVKQSQNLSGERVPASETFQKYLMGPKQSSFEASLKSGNLGVTAISEAQNSFAELAEVGRTTSGYLVIFCRQRLADGDSNGHLTDAMYTNKVPENSVSLLHRACSVQLNVNASGNWYTQSSNVDVSVMIMLSDQGSGPEAGTIFRNMAGPDIYSAFLSGRIAYLFGAFHVGPNSITAGQPGFDKLFSGASSAIWLGGGILPDILGLNAN